MKETHIVIEGVDASGKSTLAKALADRFDLPIQGSEGPPHFPGEMNRRLERYARIWTSCIFDRHPAVSQAIYGTMRTHQDDMDPSLVHQFYDDKPIFIYCDPLTHGMSHHQRNSLVDTDDHLRQVEEHYVTLLTLYRAWAIKHAHLMYRIGDDATRIIKAVKGMLLQ